MSPHAIVRDSRPLRLIVGYFDPLYAPHVRRLAELSGSGEQIVAAVADQPQALLGWRARAELVAGLRCIDYVIDAAGAAEMADAAITAEMDDERSNDLERRDALVRRILQRNQGS